MAARNTAGSLASVLLLRRGGHDLTVGKAANGQAGALPAVLLFALPGLGLCDWGARQFFIEKVLLA